MPTVIEGIRAANSINNDETFGRVAPVIRVARGRNVTQAMERTASNGQEDTVKRYSISVIPGDGVGVDVIAEGLRVLRRAGEVTGSYAIETTVYPWSCQWHLEHGAMMPEDGLDRLRDSDSIYLGAVGFPGVPDHVSLWGLLRIECRRRRLGPATPLPRSHRLDPARLHQRLSVRHARPAVALVRWFDRQRSAGPEGLCVQHFGEPSG
ncbi:MAG TPA: isocitrate/isopropylmalate family dehydrogenase [Tepidiformaceae bacterium]